MFIIGPQLSYSDIICTRSCNKKRNPKMVRPSLTLLACFSTLLGSTLAQGNPLVSGVALQITDEDYCNMTPTGSIGAKVQL